MPMDMAEATPEQRGILRGLLDKFINPSIMENQIDLQPPTKSSPVKFGSGAS